MRDLFVVGELCGQHNNKPHVQQTYKIHSPSPGASDKCVSVSNKFTSEQ